MLLNSWLTPYLVAPVAAWLIAQLIKTILATRHQPKRDYRILFKSGSMPSSHTSTMIALSTVIAATDGINTAVFGIVAVVTAVIVYDALNVRRAVGEQGRIIERLAEKAKITDRFYKANGHVVADVLVGALIGVLTAIAVLYIL